MGSVCTFAITLRYIKIALCMAEPLQLLTLLTPFSKPSDRLVPVHWRMLPPARRGPIPALPELPSLFDERPGVRWGWEDGGGWGKRGLRDCVGRHGTAWMPAHAVARRYRWSGPGTPTTQAGTTHTHTHRHTYTHARTHTHTSPTSHNRQTTQQTTEPRAQENQENQTQTPDLVTP